MSAFSFVRDMTCEYKFPNFILGQLVLFYICSPKLQSKETLVYNTMALNWHEYRLSVSLFPTKYPSCFALAGSPPPVHFCLVIGGGLAFAGRSFFFFFQCCFASTDLEFRSCVKVEVVVLVSWS